MSFQDIFRDLEPLKTKVQNKEWRLENLYFLKDKNGNKVLFKPNWAQKQVLTNLHNQEIILKARQLGVTTLFAIFNLDEALFRPNFKCGIVCDNLDNSQSIFKDKIRYAYDNLPEWLKQLVPCKRENVRTLDFENGSSISVSTSFRSGTCQSVHISEFGPICFHNPKLAEEIVTGTLNTVGVGQRITIESTAMGQTGQFFEFCKRAEAHKLSGKPLGPMDMRFHFFPWWKHEEYCLWDPCAIPKELEEYFLELERKEKIKLSDPQKFWYTKKREVLQEKIYVEYPSTCDEAFWVSNEALYYHKQLNQLRQNGQIDKIPYNPSLPVHTAWDLGINDYNVILFFQVSPGGQIRFIDCEIGNDESLPFWVKKTKDKGYMLGTWFFPHDIQVREYGSGLTRLQILQDLGVQPQILSFQRVEDGIESVKSMLSQCFFDEVKCHTALVHIGNYKKKYNEKFNYYSGPVEDSNAHAADCLRYAIAGAKILTESRGMKTDDLLLYRQMTKPNMHRGF